MIRISPESSESDLEALLKQVEKQEIGSELKIPLNLSLGAAFGAEALLIQFIVTWARKCPLGSLSPNFAQGAVSDGLETLCAKPYGLAALTIAPKIIDHSGREIPRFEALSPGTQWVIAMDEGRYHQTTKGPTVLLLLAGMAQREYLHPLYKGRTHKSIRSRLEYSRLAEKIIISTLSLDRSFFPSKRLAALGNIIYELIKNTGDHAKTDHLGNVYPRDVRGLIARNCLVSESKFKELAQEDSNISQYFSAFLDKYNVDSSARFFELSVFDSGPGLARRWTQTDFSQLDLSDELEAVRQCFLQNQSSKETESSGTGLYSVWDLLRQMEGFLRIRTGRLSLYKSFLKNKNDDVSFNAWAPANSTPKLAPVEGFSVTILVPLKADL